ncbi:hypothetical protein VM1G_10254 [Cytospora mali]|uniref:F-box domain-containing protein n=1 Tax=Cytospora mali TaxID=578113 RepID=A0A194VI17_CYTMA|nr:hypothetical protein VM1G_10254 [Valsa mali]
MTMDRLSPEIISMIASHLSAKPKNAHIAKLSPRTSTYACISREWQAAIERYTFSHINLKSSDLPAFAAVFSSNPYRRVLLRRLAYRVCLPTHGDSRADHERNLQAFRVSMKGLMDLLSQWETTLCDHNGRGSGAGTLELSLDFDWDIESDADGPVDHNFNVCNSSAARRYLVLENGGQGQGADIPAVRRVTDFKVEACLGLAPHPATMCQLAGLFPNLEGLDLEFRDPAIKRHQMRLEHRAALAKGLDVLRERLPGLKRLCIRRQGATDPWNHGFVCQDLEDSGVDLLCASVRRIVQAGTLTELELLDILVSPDLFRDPHCSDSGALATFPSLKRFNISVGILAPSGKWYYTGDPDAVEAGSLDPGEIGFEDDDEDDEDVDSDEEESDNDEDHTERDAIANGERPCHLWRTRPDTETFDPLVRSMAEAVLHRMPSLEWGCLEVGTDQDTPVGVIIQCCAAGQSFVQPPDRISTRDKPYPEDKRVRRCKAWVGLATEWHVPDDVTALWKEWVGDEGKIEMVTWPPMRGG